MFFWYMTPCKLVGYLLIGWTWCRLLQGNFYLNITYISSIQCVLHSPNVTYGLSNSVETPSRLANSWSVSQVICSVLWNLIVHYRIHKIPKVILVLSQMSAVRTFFKMFCLMLPYYLLLGLPSGLLSTDFLIKTLLCVSLQCINCINL
jgi:hypothetical protein